MFMLFTKQYTAIGIMSGTSLDGVDIVYCSFTFDKKWQSEIIFSECIPYDRDWKDQINNIHKASGQQLLFIHNQYGSFLGNLVNSFMKKNKVKSVDCIASHGHTIFHEPEKGLTFQLGAGPNIAATTKHTVVSDFRSLDVALSGQGAPLVPFGDSLLFEDFDYCLNLGGIANISYRQNKKQIGADITFANMASNSISSELGYSYDKNGFLASSGSINELLLEKLNSPAYFKKNIPKSLAREDYENWFMPLLKNSTISPEDKLATLGFHIAQKISESIVDKSKNILVTGGGTYNKYWLDLMQNHFSINCSIPEKNIIDFKEALIFAFLGIMSLEKKHNILQSVTGASRDSIGGVISYG